VLVPDSVDYARYLGLDLEAWYDEGLVDLVTGGDYMQLTTWAESANMVHAHPNLRFYAGLHESRLPEHLDLRKTTEAFRGRATAALGSGADGVLLTNAVYSSSAFQTLYAQIGAAPTVAGSNRLHFASFMGGGHNPGRIPNYDGYFDGEEPLSTEDPILLAPGSSKAWSFQLGNGSDHPRRAYLYLRTERLTAEQKQGALVPSGRGLYLRIVESSGRSTRLTMDPHRYYPPSSRVASYVSWREKESDPTYEPRMLGFTVPAALLGADEFTVQVVNDSGTPAYIEDLFLHGTDLDTVPEIGIEEVFDPQGNCAVQVSGVQTFRDVGCLSTLNLYVVQNGWLHRIHSEDGAWRVLGAQEWSGATSAARIGGSVYVIQNSRLHKIDPIDGTFTVLGNAEWGGLTAMAAAGGSLYITKGGALWRVSDLATGASARVGTANWTGATSMASLGGYLYIVQNRRLHRVDPTNGSYTVLGGSDWSGATAMTAVNGTLYLTQGGKLWRIVDLVAGSYERLGSESWEGATSMAALGSHLYIIQNGLLHRVNAFDGSYTVLGDPIWGGPTVMAAL
jgi:hypothetical protein